jgi:phospholipid/cholesterol/gamma-HCH transport system permease protein
MILTTNPQGLPLKWTGRICGYVGRTTLDLMEKALVRSAFTFRILALLVRRPKNGRSQVKRAVVEQVYFTAVQALPLIIPLALLVGSALIIQFTKISGEFELGKVAVILIIREIAPLITALVVILRSATAVTAEMSCMTVFNEIEAMEMAGVDPMWVLSFSRFTGITSAVVCLFIVFDLAALFGGQMVTWVTTSQSNDTFLLEVARAISGTDLVVSLIKALLFGLIITVVSLFHGYTTVRKVSRIPVSVSQAAVESFFVCMIVNAFVSIVFYQ